MNDCALDSCRVSSPLHQIYMNYIQYYVLYTIIIKIRAIRGNETADETWIVSL